MVKKQMHFKTLASLQTVIKLVNEVGEALNEQQTIIQQKIISAWLSAILGSGLGGVASFATLYQFGLNKLNLFGLKSSLQAIGKIIGGGHVAGICLLAMPVVILGSFKPHSNKNNDSTKKL